MSSANMERVARNGHVGRISPQGITQHGGDSVAPESVGLRCADPAYETEEAKNHDEAFTEKPQRLTKHGEQMQKDTELSQLIRRKLEGLEYEL